MPRKINRKVTARRAGSKKTTSKSSNKWGLSTIVPGRGWLEFEFTNRNLKAEFFYRFVLVDFTKKSILVSYAKDSGKPSKRFKMKLTTIAANWWNAYALKNENKIDY